MSCSAGDGSSFAGPPIETSDERGFTLDEPTEVDNPIPELPSAGELCAWWSFGHQMSLAVFGRSEPPEVMHAWLEAQGLSSLVSCDVPRSSCYSLDRQPCSVGSSGDCRGPLGVAKLLLRRSIL
jgi:hypothetical protein